MPFDMINHILEGYEKEGRASAVAFLNEHSELTKIEVQALKNSLEESMFDTFEMTEFAETLSYYLGEDRFRHLNLEDRVCEAFYHGVDRTLADALKSYRVQNPLTDGGSLPSGGDGSNESC